MAQWVKNVTLSLQRFQSLLWYRFYPWSRNFRVPWKLPKKKKKDELFANCASIKNQHFTGFLKKACVNEIMRESKPACGSYSNVSSAPAVLQILAHLELGLLWSWAGGFRRQGGSSAFWALAQHSLAGNSLLPPETTAPKNPPKQQKPKKPSPPNQPTNKSKNDLVVKKEIIYHV